MKSGGPRRPKHRLRRLWWLLAILVIAGGLVNYFRPLPALYPVAELPKLTAGSVSLAWPSGTEAAVGAQGYGVLASSGAQTPKPTASVAKLITALTVLQRYPLTSSQTTTPLITLGPNDVDLYNQYLAEQGSVVKVTAGEQLSEYQMLEAMLLPSANNIADSLAIWAYGSLAAYATAANQYVASIGLTNTQVGTDASGFLPTSTSTAHDLVLLGQVALNNPVIAGIVSQKQVTLPVAGTVLNVNYLLGSDGIIGIKTGNTDQAGGVYIFGAIDQLDAAHSVTVIGSLVGAVNLATALSDSLPLLNSVKTDFSLDTLLPAGQIVARYKLPWGGSVSAAVSQPLTVAVWKGNAPQFATGLRDIYAPLAAGSNLGNVSSVNNGPATSSPVVLNQTLAATPWWWRLIRFKF